MKWVFATFDGKLNKTLNDGTKCSLLAYVIEKNMMQDDSRLGRWALRSLLSYKFAPYFRLLSKFLDRPCLGKQEAFDNMYDNVKMHEQDRFNKEYTQNIVEMWRLLEHKVMVRKRLGVDVIRGKGEKRG